MIRIQCANGKSPSGNIIHVVYVVAFRGAGYAGARATDSAVNTRNKEDNLVARLDQIKRGTLMETDAPNSAYYVCPGLICVPI